MTALEGLIFRHSPEITGGYTDASGNYDGTNDGASIVTEAGKDMYSFAGAEHVSVPNLFTGMAAFTLSAWVKPDSLPASQYLCASLDGAVSNGVQIYLRATTGILDCILRSGGTFNDAANDGTGVSAGVLTHVAITWDGTTLKRYVDGTNTGTNLTTSIASIGDSGVSLYLGAGNSNGTESLPFDGLIGDVMIFDVAKTAGEISDIYSAGRDALLYPVPLNAETADTSLWSIRTPENLHSDDGEYAVAGKNDDGEVERWTYNTTLKPATVEDLTLEIVHSNIGGSGTPRARIRYDGSTWSAWENLTASTSKVTDTVVFAVSASISGLDLELEAPSNTTSNGWRVFKAQFTATELAVAGGSIAPLSHILQQQRRR